MSTWLHTHYPRLKLGETPDVISVKVPGQKIDYACWVSLKDARFVVHEKGRQRTLRDLVRNVHAWVVGEEILRLEGDWKYLQSEGYVPAGYRRAVYDPWKGGTFVDLETLEPVYEAPLVIMSGKHVWYVPSEG